MEVHGSNPTLLFLEGLALWNGLLCFCLSSFLNLLLVLSILRYSPPHMGVYYKIVQSLLSLCSIILSALVVLTRPTMHVHSGIFIFSADPPFSFPRLPLLFLLYAFLFLFVQNKGILSTLMIYRILRMRLVHTHRLHPFIGLLLPSVSLLISLPITALLIVVLIPSEEKGKRCLGESKGGEADSSLPCSTVEREIEGHLSPQSSFLLSTISEGETRNWWFLSAMLLLVLLLLSASFIINIGAKKISTQATKARDSLQRQLARALYAQSLVPSLLVQIPIGIGVGGSLFNQDMDSFFHLLPIVSAWYTVADPLIVFHNVRSYRQAVFRVLRLPCWKDGVSPGGTAHLEMRSSKAPAYLTRPMGLNEERSKSAEPQGMKSVNMEKRRASGSPGKGRKGVGEM